MKDLLTLTIVGVLLFWVMVWPDNGWADVIFDDNKAMVLIKVFSF